MGRNKLIRDEEVVILSPRGATAKLQTRSMRRAIVDALVQHGGSMTMAEINRVRGYDCRSHVGSLVKAGWLSVEVKP
jgi:hypothetical protein